MTLEEVKAEIERRSGVPAALLDCDTAEENIAKAKALLAYKRENGSAGASTAEKFGAWFNSLYGEQTEPDFSGLESNGKAFPSVKDGGEVSRMASLVSARERFAEWLDGY